MSVMTTNLGARRVSAAPDEAESAGDGGVYTVSGMRPGDRARVVDICDTADAATARRFFDLGFAPGAEIVAIRRAPMRGPVILRVAGYEIALRRAQAECIRVDRAPSR